MDSFGAWLEEQQSTEEEEEEEDEEDAELDAELEHTGRAMPDNW